MFTLIAKLVIAFPQALKLFIRIQNEIAKNFKDARFERNRRAIDQWVRDNDGDTGVQSPGISEPGGGASPKPPTVD